VVLELGRFGRRVSEEKGGGMRKDISKKTRKAIKQLFKLSMPQRTGETTKTSPQIECQADQKTDTGKTDRKRTQPLKGGRCKAEKRTTLPEDRLYLKTMGQVTG